MRWGFGVVWIWFGYLRGCHSDCGFVFWLGWVFGWGLLCDVGRFGGFRAAVCVFVWISGCLLVLLLDLGWFA